MKRTTILIIVGVLIAAGLVALRRAVSNEIMESFIIVDNSIEKSTSQISKSFDKKLQGLTVDEGNGFKIFLLKRSKVQRMLDSLILALENQCTGEADLDCTTEIMITGNNYNLLKEAFQQFETEGTNILGYSDSTFISLSSLDGTAEEYFERIAAIAGITILNTFKNRCENASMYVVDNFGEKR